MEHWHECVDCGSVVPDEDAIALHKSGYIRTIYCRECFDRNYGFDESS